MGKNYQLIKLYLLKYQTSHYFKNKKLITAFSKEKLTRLQIRLKKVLRVIYQYHYKHQTILFVGLPTVKHKKIYQILKLSKHYFIPKNIWINGLIRNKGSIFKYLKLNCVRKEELKSLLTIKKIPDLVVIFDSSENSGSLTEFHKSNIPVINFGKISPIEKNKLSYNMENEFISKKLAKFYLFLIYSILKKPKKKNFKLFKDIFKLF